MTEDLLPRFISKRLSHMPVYVVNISNESVHKRYFVEMFLKRTYKLMFKFDDHLRNIEVINYF